MSTKGKLAIGIVLGAAVLAAIISMRHSGKTLSTVESQAPEVQSAETAAQLSTPSSPAPVPTGPPNGPAAVEPTTPAQAAEVAPLPGHKLERLKVIRARFEALAAGDPGLAFDEAMQITDENDRELALVTLVTQWTGGELGPARERARAIATYGLEAGLGFELAKNPQLAILWANKLTEGRGRFALLQHVGGSLVTADPAVAFGLSEQLQPQEQRAFVNSLFARWGDSDTEAALRWAEQMSDADERAAAIQAIRTTAPVGIGAAVAIQDGYPIINGLVPGSPAELSGQLRAGDRIVGLAQGDNAFVDARGMALEKIVQQIRGAPSTLLQLQVVSADAPPNSAPRIVSVFRDQIKFKR